MIRYFIELSFKGTGFFGWQTQPKQITVQDTLAGAMHIILQQDDIKLIGCGRTDTGVHASQFFAHFDLEKTLPDPQKTVFKLNGMLPSGIAVQRIFKVDSESHARFDASSRTYQYHIHKQKNPFSEDTSLLFYRELDVDKMNDGAQLVLTYSDFVHIEFPVKEQ